METIKTHYAFSRYSDLDLTLSVRKDEKGYHARVWNMVTDTWTSEDFPSAVQAEVALKRYAEEMHKVYI